MNPSIKIHIADASTLEIHLEAPEEAGSSAAQEPGRPARRLPQYELDFIQEELRKAIAKLGTIFDSYDADWAADVASDVDWQLQTLCEYLSAQDELEVAL